jgi:hypothetical protein
VLLPTLIAIPLILIWILTLVDIVRRHDLGGGSKALWIAATFIVPVIGPIVYFVVRPAATSASEQESVIAAATADPPYSPSEAPTARRGPA